MSDDKMSEQPEAKPTKALPKDEIMQAQLSQLLTRATETRDAVARTDTKVDRLAVNVDTLMGESTSLHGRVGLIEGRIAKLETPSIVPPSPITSVRVREILDATPSQMDLEQQAKLAATIVKTGELEAAIHDTRALAEKAVETLEKQSDFMGMGKKGLAWLRSKEARADIIRFITLVGVGYAALKSAGVIK